MQFKAEVFQNQFLPQGIREVHAIMTVSAEGNVDSPAQITTNGEKLFGIICDISGSMSGNKIYAVKSAMTQLVNLLPENVFFFVVTGHHEANLTVPLLKATPENKQKAIAAIKSVESGGTTAISTWLNKALEQFQRMPNALRQALLLTDGQNDKIDERPLHKVLLACEGVFQCDCRGVGTDWKVAQLQEIGNKLLGTTDIIPNPAAIEADFRNILNKALSKSISDVAMRIWTPQGAKILFCKQVSPEIADLSDRARMLKPQLAEYPTGAWGKAESRDYHFCIEVNAGNVGDEMLAGRASLICTADGVEDKVAEAKILAIWTDDDAKSTKIDLTALANRRD